MAKYDHGGGCGCGLEKECPPECEWYRSSGHEKGYDAVKEAFREARKILSKRNISIQKEMTMEDDDFGFSFSDEIIVETKVVVESTERTEKLRNMIMPLLKNLKKDADKDYIRWAGKDRVKKIDEFIAKMNNIVDGK